MYFQINFGWWLKEANLCEHLEVTKLILGSVLGLEILKQNQYELRLFSTKETIVHGTTVPIALRVSQIIT